MSPTAIGETNLDHLIRSMEPTLHSDEFVFSTFSDTANASFGTDQAELLALNPIMMFKESEGVTLILSHAKAVKCGVEFEFPCRMITLNIHSSLDAVGFLARITTALAALDMGVNPVSGFFHDHLFVPTAKADIAMRELQRLSNE